MDRLHSVEQELAPIRLSIGSDPPRVELGPEGQAVSLLESVMGFSVHFRPEGVIVDLALKGDVADLNLPVDRVVIEGGETKTVHVHPFEEITAQDIQSVLDNMGMSQSPGDAIYGWLANIVLPGMSGDVFTKLVMNHSGGDLADTILQYIRKCVNDSRSV